MGTLHLAVNVLISSSYVDISQIYFLLRGYLHFLSEIQVGTLYLKINLFLFSRAPRIFWTTRIIGFNYGL